MISGKERRGAVLLATLFAATFAVLAMHALTSHERAHSAHAAAALPLAVDAHDADHPHVGATDAPAPEEPDPVHDDGGAGELCLALLCLMAALIELALRRGIPRLLLYLVPRWTGPRLVGLGRPPDRPCLHSLSILRC